MMAALVWLVILIVLVFIGSRTLDQRLLDWGATQGNGAVVLMESYEYAIMLSGDYREPHRSGMTEDEARTWMTEWIQMSGRRAPFELARRPVGEWEPVDA